MTSKELQSLLAPASLDLSIQRATNSLDGQFASVDDLDRLDTVAAQAQVTQEHLSNEVSAIHSMQ